MKTNETRGIIVGCDGKQEFLLPFFYLNLRLHSNLPITFFDFGMTAFGHDFCQKRGNIISIHDSLYEAKSSEYKEVKRLSWFKKPLACQMAPYDKNLWIDLDVLIRAPIDEVFDLLNAEKQIAITHEYDVDVSFLSTEISIIPIYNSGFFAFFKNSPIVDSWIQISKKLKKTKIGDQDILSFDLYNRKNQIALLDPSYNRLMGSTNQDLTHHIDIETPLYINDRLKREPTNLLEAKNLHFVADTKGLLLARFSYLEKLSQKKYSKSRPEYV